MAKLKTKFIEADAVTGAKMRLDNDQFLRGRNNADSADVNLLKVNTSDQAEVGAELSMNSQKIVNLANASVSGDAVNKGQLDLKANDADVIKKDGSVAFTGNQSMGGNKLTNLGSPTADTDAASRRFVLDVIERGPSKYPVKVATDAALPANTAAGTGVGKTLTADANGALSIDGISSFTDIDNDGGVNDPFAASGKASFVLVKNEATGANNGIFAVKDKGDGTSPWILVRRIDFDEDDEIPAAAQVFVQEGTANADKKFGLTTDEAITIDTTSLTFGQSGGTDTISESDVDGTTVKFESDQVSSLIPDREIFTLTSTDITNGYVDLAQTVHSDDAVQVIPVGGLVQERGVDYTVSVSGGAGGVTRVTFAGDLSTELAENDKLIVNYHYL